MANVTIRLNNNDKEAFSAICEKIGMNVTTALNCFVKAVIREEKIPFELSSKDNDGFYNEANIKHLIELKKLDDEGKLHFVEKSLKELKEMAK